MIILRQKSFSEVEQKEFNSKAAKERNAKFFESKGKSALKEASKRGELVSAEVLANSILEKERDINGNIIRSKLNKLSGTTNSKDYKKLLDDHYVGYGKEPKPDSFKKLGVKKKNLTTGDVFKVVGRDALKEEAREAANKQKSKVSRGALLAKKILKEIK